MGVGGERMAHKVPCASVGRKVCVRRCCALCGAAGARARSGCEAAAGWGARCVAVGAAFRLCVCAWDERTARNVAVRSVAKRKAHNVWRVGVLCAGRRGWRASRE